MIHYDIALTLMPRMGSRTIMQIMERVDSASALWQMSQRELEELELSPSMVRIVMESRVNKDLMLRAQQIVDYCANRSVRILKCGDPDYSSLLAQCGDAPHVLYVRGNLDFNAGRWVSVVGTRKATSSGLYDTERLVASLGAAYPDLVVVSGLAFGIDKAAHTAALNHGIPTVCVMPGWVEEITPTKHHNVSHRILAQGGAVVSDMPPGTVIAKANFLSRNRIIAGLSSATVVVESAIKGGSLVTADIACGYNREVFAMPGRADDPACEGTNNLIKSSRATLYQDVSDIAQSLGWEREAGVAQVVCDPSSLPDALREVFCAMLDTAPVSLDFLSEALGRPVSGISSAMMHLESRGFIKSLPGRLYQKSKF